MTSETNRDHINRAIDSTQRDIVRNAQTLYRIDWYKRHVAPVLPKGAELPDNPWSYSDSHIEVSVPPVEGRPWRGLQGTAGVIYRVRKALNVVKFKRSTEPGYNNDFTTYFMGKGLVDGKAIEVTVTLRNQIPDTCQIVWVDEEVPAQPATTRKVMKTMCNDPAPITETAVEQIREAVEDGLLSPELEELASLS